MRYINQGNKYSAHPSLVTTCIMICILLTRQSEREEAEGIRESDGVYKSTYTQYTYKATYAMRCILLAVIHAL